LAGLFLGGWRGSRNPIRAARILGEECEFTGLHGLAK